MIALRRVLLSAAHRSGDPFLLRATDVSGPVAPPNGYVRLDEPNATIVARADVAEAVLTAYRSAPTSEQTLHGFARRATTTPPYVGRGEAFRVTLPGAGAVVVRHNRHGGALRALTGDLFWGATRAPHELAMSLRLLEKGVATPAVLAYAVYAGPLGFSRSDVVTADAGGSDLAARLADSTGSAGSRDQLWKAVSLLILQLSAAGARHHDLNVKNVLIVENGGEVKSMALDVDRVEFGNFPEMAWRANIDRLVRSLWKTKWAGAVVVAEHEIFDLERQDLRLD